MSVPSIQSSILEADGISHGFFTRQGGVSDGLYRSLNCGYGSGDDMQAVAANRRRVTETLGVGKLVTCHQIHSADAVVVGGADAVVVGGADGRTPWQPSDAPRADALATKMSGVALGVLAADCAPVVFVEPKARVIAAAHAGWRGALTGITDAAIEAMIRLGADRGAIFASVGPCIAQDSYEVGPEFPTPFLEENNEAASFFEAGSRDGHWQFDLPAYVVGRLLARGLAGVAGPDHDTYADEETFFSYRRSCHRDEPSYGRCISAVALTG